MFGSFKNRRIADATEMRSQFVVRGMLQMKLVLEKFCQYYGISSKSMFGSFKNRRIASWNPSPVHASFLSGKASAPATLSSRGMLQMKLVLEKFCQYYGEIYGEREERFLEEDGRRLFVSS